MVMLKIIEVYCDTAVIFGFLNLDLFSYPNNMISLFKDIGLYIIAASIRPVFLESQKILACFSE